MSKTLFVGIDAFVIADRFRFGRLPKPYNQHQPYLPLRRLTLYRLHLIKTSTSLAFILEDFSLDELVVAPVENLLDFICKHGKNRFTSQAALAKFAELTWRKSESGDFKGEITRMTKTGNKYLRYYLIKAANSLRVHNEEYKAYYQSKFDEVTKHQHKRALALTANKLFRLVFSLLKNNQLYHLAVGRSLSTT